MASENEINISLTHFINPQLFWYHKIDVPNKAYHAIVDLELQLAEYYKNHQPWTQSVRSPEIGALVAVKFLAWNKLIRARVMHIAAFSKNVQGGKFIMWSVDHGFPFQTEAEHVFRLPEKLSVSIKHIKCGGLTDILAADKVFDFRRNCAETTVQENWSQHACDLADKLLNEADSIVFIERFCVEEHTWGELIVTTHLGVKCRMRDYLIGMNLALESGPNFRETCLKLKTTQILPWMTNSGNSKFSANKAFLYTGNSRDSNEAKSPLSAERDDYAKRKVEDWCARNEMVGREAELLESTTEDSVVAVSLNDSASNKVENNAESKVPTTIELLDQQMCLAGTLTKSRIEKYASGHMPPKPHNIAFDMSDSSVIEPDSGEMHLLESVASVSTRSSISSRKQKLLEIRKQLGSKAAENSKSINHIKETDLIELTADSTLNSESNGGMESDNQVKDTTSSTNSLNRLPLAATSRIKKNLESRKKQETAKVSDTSATSDLKSEECSTSQTAPSKYKAKLMAKAEKLKAKQQEKKDETESVASSGSSSRVSRNLEARLKLAKENILNTSETSETDNSSQTGSNSAPSKYIELIRKAKAEKLKTQQDNKYEMGSSNSSHTESQCATLKFAETIPVEKLQAKQEIAKEVESTSSSGSSSRLNRLREARQKHARTNILEINAKSETNNDSCAATPIEAIQKNKFEKSEMQHHKNIEDSESVVSSAGTVRAARLLNMRKKHIDSTQIGKLLDKKTESNKQLANEEENLPNTFHGLRMIPAGYDFANMNRYKDEKNHWHCKKSTLHDHVPHDDVELLQNSADLLKVTPNSSPSSASGALENCSSKVTNEQNFRHTRSHTDKYKHNSKEEEQNILDTTVPKLSDKPMSFSIAKIENDAELSKENLPNNVNADNFSPLSIKSKKMSRRRILKSPSTQITKIDEILSHAKNEKENGNEDILDLNNLNSSGSRLDSDNTELHSALEDGFGTTSDNEDSELDQKSSNKRSLIENRLQMKRTAQQAHLKRLEDRISYELNVMEVQNSYKIQLPLVQELREVEGEHDVKTKLIDHLVLAHSKVPLYTLEKISDAFFFKEIHDEMLNMRVTKLYRIQAYAWPHLLRGNSLFIVNPPKSGKTWSYLPAICNLVSYHVQNGTTSNIYGPVAIILVPSSLHVEKVHSCCKRLLLGIKAQVTTVASFGVRNANESKIQLLNGCGILVATPASLLRLLQDNEKESLIDPTRLKHLVIDDMDLMISRSQNDFETVVKTLFKMCRRTEVKPVTVGLQLVLTSRHFYPTMVAVIRKSNQPLLLIGDFIEAAVYGKVMISIKLCPSEKKITTIIHFIEKYSLEQERLLILCNSDDDVYEVVDALTASAYICMGYDSSATADCLAIIDEWKKKKVVSSRILVCADSAFPELQIQNVRHVIHYSMPTSWTKFTMRFSAMAQTYENYVSKNFELTVSPNEPAPHSIILLDEENSMQLPRLIDFMKKHDQLNFIHKDILAVSKRVFQAREEERRAQGTRMCPYVLEFGECDETRCDYRHNLFRFDAVSKSDNIPTCGDIRILVLKVFSPTYYAARLLQHRAINSTDWVDVRRSNEVCNFAMHFNLHYMKRENWVLHWPLHVGDLCVYKVCDSYQRASILELPDIQNADIIKMVKLTVKLIDQGTIISSVKSDELFICHDKFKNFPAQAIDIRLVGVVPFDNERTWDSKATKSVQNWIMTDITKDECVHVSINFALANTIWVNNVIVMEQLPTVGQYVYRVNLKRSLVKKEIAAIADAQRPSIQNIAEEFGLLSNIESSESEIEFQSCTENDTSNLIKFSSNDDTIECEDDKSTKHGSSPKELAPIGKKTEKNSDDEENWDELLLNDSNGKEEIYLPITTNNTQQPVDNCQNSKKSSCNDIKEEWIDLPMHELTKVEIGDEGENGNWNDIYLQCIEDEHLNKFNKLLELINEHIAAVKESLFVPFPASWFKPMQNCIVHYNDRYLRAKLYGVFGGDGNASSCIYRFFLCDYACFVMSNADELYDDFLYATTKEIIEFTPYQAVHCTLTGIQLDKFAKRHMVTKDYLFAYAVSKHEDRPTTVPEFTIHSFDILLYENETENNLNTAQLLNKALISNGVATPHDDTKHHLDLDLNMTTNRDSNINGLCNFEQLLECIQRSLELEAEEQLLRSTEDEEKVRKTVISTKAICMATKEQQKLNGAHKSVNGVSTTEQVLAPASKSSKIEASKSRAQGSTSDSGEDPLNSTISTEHEQYLSSLSTLSEIDTLRESPPPAIMELHKRPQTTWYDTECLIYLTIHAPDVEEYLLEVAPDTLQFAACIQEQEHVLVLNLLGIVVPEFVSHEIRGVNVIVRLVKSVFMKWPRLLQQTTKFSWLKYNLNAIETKDLEHLLPQQQLESILQSNYVRKAGNGYSSDDSDDSEHNLFQTFTPIVNSEDIHDPTEEMF